MFFEFFLNENKWYCDVYLNTKKHSSNSPESQNQKLQNSNREAIYQIASRGVLIQKFKLPTYIEQAETSLIKVYLKTLYKHNNKTTKVTMKPWQPYFPKHKKELLKAPITHKQRERDTHKLACIIVDEERIQVSATAG